MNLTMDQSSSLPDDYEFRALTDVQKKVLVILPIPSALLSIFGSTIIIIMLWKVRIIKTWIPYQRLLLAMSICDIISSITLAIGSFLYPQETSDKVWVSLRNLIWWFLNQTIISQKLIHCRPSGHWKWFLLFRHWILQSIILHWYLVQWDAQLLLFVYGAVWNDEQVHCTTNRTCDAHLFHRLSTHYSLCGTLFGRLRWAGGT